MSYEEEVLSDFQLFACVHNYDYDSFDFSKKPFFVYFLAEYCFLFTVLLFL